MFAKRLLSSIFLWAILTTVIFRLGMLAAALLCSLVILIALSEFFDILEKGGLRCSKIIGLGSGLLLTAGSWCFNARMPEFVNTFEIILLTLMVIVLFVRKLWNGDKNSGIAAIGNTLLGVIYIPLLFNFIPKIICLYPTTEIRGQLFIFYLVVVTKFCDTGAYVTGRMFGRHKFIPRISPNKTWEGVLGGLVVGMIASATVFEYLRSRMEVVGFTFADAMALGLILGIFGIVGDLAESFIKRETHVKDSGEVLPGIGGALDLIDSLLFTAPALYVYLILFVKPNL